MPGEVPANNRPTPPDLAFTVLGSDSIRALVYTGLAQPSDTPRTPRDLAQELFKPAQPHHKPYIHSLSRLIRNHCTETLVPAGYVQPVKTRQDGRSTTAYRATKDGMEERLAQAGVTLDLHLRHTNLDLDKPWGRAWITRKRSPPVTRLALLKALVDAPKGSGSLRALIRDTDILESTAHLALAELEKAQCIYKASRADASTRTIRILTMPSPLPQHYNLTPITQAIYETGQRLGARNISTESLVKAVVHDHPDINQVAVYHNLVHHELTHFPRIEDGTYENHTVRTDYSLTPRFAPAIATLAVRQELLQRDPAFAASMARRAAQIAQDKKAVTFLLQKAGLAPLPSEKQTK